MYVKLEPTKSPKGFEDNSLIYQYTSLDAMLGIVRPDSIIMWATHYQYLNDRDEIAKGVEAMKKHEESLHASQFENLFIISFSTNEDDLSMWHMYSGAYSGCILGFRKERIGGNMVKCIYNEEEAGKSLGNTRWLLDKGAATRIDENGSLCGESRSILNGIMKSFVMTGAITSTAIGLKNKEFAFEDEVRVFINLEEKNSHIIKYRKRNSEIIPYIECLIEKDALAEIWIPNNEAKGRTKKSIERMLKQYGYNNTKVKVSNTSFRP